MSRRSDGPSYRYSASAIHFMYSHQYLNRILWFFLQIQIDNRPSTSPPAPKLTRDQGSTDERRRRFTTERTALALRRLSFEARVGRVARRTFGTTAAASSIAFRRIFANRRFAPCVRSVCDRRISSPSAVSLAAKSAVNRSVIRCGRPARKSANRSCTALATLFTFCPPGPVALTASHVTASAATV